MCVCVCVCEDLTGIFLPPKILDGSIIELNDYKAGQSVDEHLFKHPRKDPL